MVNDLRQRPEQSRRPHSRRIRRFTLIGLLIGLVLLALAQLVPPRVIPATAPATQFSADRAMHSLEVIASQPRPMGSPGHTAAREFLLQQIQAMGLQPEVQRTTVVQRWQGSSSFEVGRVQNVLVRLPGTASTGAIALDGHYDSGSTADGAADCGSCVVTLLETLRALRSAPPLQNDVIFVFADGEENSDLGAHAFVTQHPWRQDVRLALNFEATGNGGANVLYSAHRHNLSMIAGFVRAVPHPFASSFASDFVRLFPQQRGGCDLEEYMDWDIPGLGFALARNTVGYHTRLDNVQQIDRRSIQDQGADALALVNYFGNQDLNKLQADQGAVYFNLLPRQMVYYPVDWVLPFAAIVGLLYGSVVLLGLRRRQLTARGLIGGTIAFSFSAIGSVMLASLLWWGIRTVNPNLQVFMVGHYQTPLYFSGLVCFTVALIVAFNVWIGSRISLPDRMAGALTVWLVLMVMTSVAMPGASYLLTVPLLVNLLLLGWMMGDRGFQAGSWIHLIVLVLAAIPGIFLLIPAMLYPNLAWMMRFELFSNLPFLASAMIFIVLLVGLLLPQIDFLTIDSRRRWLVPGILGLTSLVILSVATATSGFDAQHPQPDRIAYEMNANTDKAFWVSRDAQLDDWTAQFFPAETVSSQYESFPGSSGQAFTTPAPTVALAAPIARTISDTRSDSERNLHLQITSPRQALNLQVQMVAQGEITLATVNGQPMNLQAFPPEQRTLLNFSYYNLPPEGIDLRLTVQSPQPLQVTLQDLSYGLPQIPEQTIAPRPPDKMPAPPDLDPTIATKTFAV